MTAGWKPYETHMQAGLKDGNFANGQFVYVAAGPPHLENLSGPTKLGGQGLVHPIGLCQNLAVSHNRVFSRIFEIGGERSYFIPGRTVGQLTMSRVYFHGPTLLRALYAYYHDEINIEPLLGDASNFALDNLYPWLASKIKDSSDGPVTTGSMYKVQIPPGWNNFWNNLASDVFQYPFGLMFMVRDSNQQNIGGCYVEQCYVPTHTMALDSQGLIIQESVGIQFERLVPLKTNAVALFQTPNRILNVDAPDYFSGAAAV